MTVIWLDRDGFIEKKEYMTAKQAVAKVGPLLKSGAALAFDEGFSMHQGRYCAAVDIAEGTLTLYARGGSWCRENRERCRGNGCRHSMDA